MNGISCTKCGAANPPNSAFCGTCGAPLPQQTAPQPPTSDPAQWQQPASGQQPAGGQSAGWQQPGANAQWQPPAGTPPPGGYPPPPPGYAYPPQYSAQKITGDNTKWALGLGIAGILCCGPFTAIPGFFMAKKDMDEIAAGRAPQLNDGMAKAAYYLNIAAIALFIVGLFFWLGVGGLRRF